MSGAIATKRPAASRPFSLGGHGAFALLMLAAVPLMFAFVWQHGLATLNDDSFSYLTLARHLGGGRTFVEPWAWQHSHFPPLFPLVLAATGGSHDFLVGHLVVAAFSALAVVAMYRFAERFFASRLAGFLLACAFLLTPTAWLSIKGILSEPMYLLLSLAALHVHAARIDRPRPAARDALVFGALVALAYLTRSAGLTLIVAYGVHVAIRLLVRRERPAWPLFLPAVPVAALSGAWALVRPGDGAAYRDQAFNMFGQWLDKSGQLVHTGWELLFGGWISSFHAETLTGGLPTAVFATLGALGLAGAVRRAVHNRLDGWYVLVTLALLMFWIFPQDTMRRLLYPVVPLLLIHAADAVLWTCRRLRIERYRAHVLFAVAALPVALCVPALVLMAQKAANREPVSGTAHSYSEITDYYRFVNEGVARELAGAHLVTLAGFEALAHVTPPGARVMWTRPEFVALLGKREGVPFQYEWDTRDVALEIRRTRTDYIVLTALYKVDVAMIMGNPGYTLRDVWSYADPVLTLGNPVNRTPQFILLKVDPARLDDFIHTRKGKPPGN
jgi:hypothetical protein